MSRSACRTVPARSSPRSTPSRVGTDGSAPKSCRRSRRHIGWKCRPAIRAARPVLTRFGWTRSATRPSKIARWTRRIGLNPTWRPFALLEITAQRQAVSGTRYSWPSKRSTLTLRTSRGCSPGSRRPYGARVPTMRPTSCTGVRSPSAIRHSATNIRRRPSPLDFGRHSSWPATTMRQPSRCWRKPSASSNAPSARNIREWRPRWLIWPTSTVIATI